MAEPARIWRCGAHTLSLDTPLTMGILNVTPDSFSDGGSYSTVEDAVSHGLEMVEHGAAIVDVGGESTRPGSAAVSVDEEIARVVPVVKALAAAGVLVSVDTRHAPVAQAVIDAGACIINDVSGFSDPAMVEVAAQCDAGLVVMHMIGQPATMQNAPHYDDVFSEVRDYLLGQAATLVAAGVDPSRICLDPGFGFAKTDEHNLEVLRRTRGFVETGFPVMVAVSRKRTIGAVTGVETPSERDAGSIAAALFAVERGATVVRVHNVEYTIQALRVFNALSEGISS